MVKCCDCIKYKTPACIHPEYCVNHRYSDFSTNRRKNQTIKYPGHPDRRKR